MRISDWSSDVCSADRENIKNGIAQSDGGSTGSGFTNSAISQRYAQLDLVRRFDSVLSALRVGGKWREMSIHRETGRNEWYADPATKRRYQDTPEGAVARPEYFYDNPIGNIAGGFDASSFPGINFENYLDYINDTYGPSVRVPEPNNTYDLKEKVFAGYVQADFEAGDRKSVLSGKSVSLRVDLGGRRIFKKKKSINEYHGLECNKN